jgi:nitric oxide reductase subunit B
MRIKLNTGRLFLFTALVMLLLGLLSGVLASQNYLFPGLLEGKLGFIVMRPVHVSAVLFWILIGATGCVYLALEELFPGRMSRQLAYVQWLLWMIAICGVFYSYYNNKFGGREYWEFDPVWALPIALSWLLFIVNFAKGAMRIRRWPVYVWMWLTGLVFFLFTFTESYLWLFPYFRQDFIADSTIQWKANGSMVGAWNQIIYGTAFYLMDRISGQRRAAHSKLAFFMYFLGLFNLMFNWGHHIYPLPTQEYVRYFGYAVSMTEWIIFARIIYMWRQAVTDAQKHYYLYPYRFLLAADFWVLLNLGQALLMSIPALNRYTHGTHVTVAHAMGTTIGINSMILFAACFTFIGGRCLPFSRPSGSLTFNFWLAQAGLFVFWLSLNVAGIKKGIWLMSREQEPFQEMMKGLQPWFILFGVAGVLLLFSLSSLAVSLIRAYVRCGLSEREKSPRFRPLRTRTTISTSS